MASERPKVWPSRGRLKGDTPVPMPCDGVTDAGGAPSTLGRGRGCRHVDAAWNRSPAPLESSATIRERGCRGLSREA